MATDVRDALRTLLCYIGDPEDWKAACKYFEDPSGIKEAIADAYAAIVAADRVRAEVGTAGMEILRLVAAIPLWRDRYHDAEKDVVSAETLVSVGVTARHVRAARAVVAAAERKEVMPDRMDDASRQHDATSSPTHLATPPTAGPSPEAGAPHRTFADPGMQADYDVLRAHPPSVESHVQIRGAGGRLNAYVVGYEHPDEPCHLWPRNSRGYAAWAAGVDNRKSAAPPPQPPAGALPGMSAHEAVDKFYSDRKHRTVEPSPQPPAPAAAPDVAGLAAKLKRYANNVHSVGAQYTLTSDDAAKAADALTAQAAEIERLTSLLAQKDPA